MKRHFEVLDGLRGTAALLVVIFHLLEASVSDAAFNLLHHAYLAVDFFFMLSGFVIGYSYDDRWPAMTISRFLRTRFIRLQPLVILGVLIGAIGYLLDPFAGEVQHGPLWRLLSRVVLGVLLIPSPSMPNRNDETHSLNAPSWSLSQEWLINIVYAFIGPKISKQALVILVLISGIVLTATAVNHGNLQGGWGWETLWMAPVRVAFPFFGGLLLYRIGVRITIPMAWPLLSFVLLIVFVLPYFTWNGAYEAAIIIIVFPLIIAAGAGAHTSGKLASVCRLFGQLSYPLYILHFPAIYLYTHWIQQQHPPAPLISLVAACLLVIFIAVAWLALRLYDEPIRARLNGCYPK